ncbi:hypothetical protein [Flavobacterium sp. 3HN19-14]|uniref:hypothetical protein n=1 Tax=Flavobacterium sp. 3HN19-14 TaxID=3448133 RepID=UPI003EE3146A
MSVTALSERVGWSSRQMNRYFSQQFGLSLKSYCNILRFRASLAHIARGSFFRNLISQTRIILSKRSGNFRE